LSHLELYEIGGVFLFYKVMGRPKICGIYKITSPSGKVYIGESVDINKRFKNYNNLRCKSQTILYRSFLKYTPENHIFEIIEECLEESLKCRERYWQDFYDVINPAKGLNCKLTSCGDKKLVHSEETRKKFF
jgi:group I intron endonuclease